MEAQAADLYEGLHSRGYECTWYKPILDSDGDHFLFSPLFNRTPVSRYIDCCSLAKISKFWADADIFSAPKFVTFSAWQAGTISWYSAGESLSIKARQPESNATLGDYMQRDQHHQGDIRDLQRGLREVSSCGFC
jgi:hypothetical protein